MPQQSMLLAGGVMYPQMGSNGAQQYGQQYQLGGMPMQMAKGETMMMNQMQQRGGGVLGQGPGQPGANRPAKVPQPWHTAEDAKDKQAMIDHIIELLKQRKPGATEDWTEKLPQMALRLEGALYATADTKDAYIDRTTLKARLQQLAFQMGGNKANQQRPGMSAGGPGGPGGQGAVQNHPGHPGGPSTQTGYQGDGSQGMQNGDGSSQGSGHGQQMMGPPNNSQQTNPELHRQQVLKQQQQRLLLLRHASKCPHENNKCTVTPHCANMKTLWKHIMSCKDQDCKTAHCVSSRYVLSHYSKCKDVNCPVCGPVREAIRRNYDWNNKMKSCVNDQRVQMGPPNKKHKTDLSMVQQMHQPKEEAKFPLDPVSCPIFCFRPEQVDTHYKTIHEGLRFTAAKIKDYCMPLIDDLLKEKYCYAIFGAAVDPVAMALPDYTEIVKEPMDLGRVRKNLDGQLYRDMESFKRDVQLTFDNAMLYNPKQSEVFGIAKDLKKFFDNSFKKLTSGVENDVERKRKDPDHCGICGEMNVKFEPPVFYCNGRCGARIRRNAWFYHNAQNTVHMCKPCFDDTKDPIRTAEGNIYKRDFGPKVKHIEEAEEPWVQCALCDKWVHMICALFNNRRNFGAETTFVCVPCLNEKRKKIAHLEITDRNRAWEGIVAPLTKKIAASDLPHSTLSLFLENRINECLQRAYAETAAKLNVSIDDVDKCPKLSLRQVSCYDKNMTVKDGVLDRYRHKGYPTEFPCRTKCLTLFQNIDGQDVILFGMYVYEYGHKAPPPNQRRVYISYLDSVHYFRPRQYRTQVYHEIIISYLEYVKLRGFHTAHIWACPPLKGDDYILYCHPTDQKTPKDDKLRKWYVDLLAVCRERGIVSELSNIYDEYLKDPTNDATCLPYLDGDYWTNEAEEIIKDLKAGKLHVPDPIASEADADDDGKEGGGKMNEKSTRRNKNKSAAAAARPTRSGKGAGALLSRNERDPVMAKLAAILEPMKEAFFVARLRPKEYALQMEERRKQEIIEEAQQNTEAEIAKRKQLLQEEALQGQNMTTEMVIPVQTKDESEKDDEDFGKAASSVGGSVTHSKSSADMASSLDKQSDMDVDSKNESKEADAPETPITPSRRASSRGKAKGKAGSKKEDDIDGMDLDKSGSVEAATPAAEPVVEAAEVAPASNSNGSSSSSETISGLTISSEVVMKTEEVSRPEPKETGAAEVKTTEAAESTIISGLDERGIPVCFATMKDDTEDVDETQDSEHFDARTSFLNLCQGNHYQFDQLRRAKHSSMMVLYHLHNPDAPKFTPNCFHCHMDINAGHRYHCSACVVDYCTSCLRQFGARNLHPHPGHSLRPIDISGSAPTQLTEEQKRERQRNIQMHMTLLAHAAACQIHTCPSKNCHKMKVRPQILESSRRLF